MKCGKGLLLLLGILYLMSGCSPNSKQNFEISGEIDFNYHIKPILSDRCFACHGPDKNTREAGLRLDTPEGALEHLLESGNIAFVGKSRVQSEAYQRMLSDDPNELMPPPESKLALTEQEIELIGRWIDQGAEYKPHWAFIPPKRTQIPASADKSWPKNPIDYFVQDKLKQEGWEHAPVATDADLMRRVSFTLTGLPPASDDVSELLNDPGEFDLHQYVDKLLNTPAYGEHMAASWLDVARYADSDGYLDDKHRDFTPWRDWVIHAFNDNMPYDQFIAWQLAGDLIDESSQDQVLATAFNRLHKKNSEAGIIFEEYRTEYVADRTNTFGKAMLGLTLECARCHDHKYDPLSQQEYYQIFAFFNSTDELGTAVYGLDQTPGPALMLCNDEVEAKLQFVQNQIEQREDQLEELASKIHENLDDRQLTIPDIKHELAPYQRAYYPFDEITLEDEKLYTTPNLASTDKPARLTNPIHRDGAAGKALFVSEYHSIRTTKEVGLFERTDPFTISLWLYPDTLYDEAGIFYHCENLRLGYKGYTLNLDDNKLQFIIAHSWPQNALQVTSLAQLPVKTWTHVTITYDGSSNAEEIKLYINGNQADMNIDRNNLYKGIIYEPDIHTYGFDGFYLGFRDKIPVYRDGGLDEVRIFSKELTSLEVKYLYDPQNYEQNISSDPASTELLRSHWVSNKLREHSSDILDQLHGLRERENHLGNDIQEIMVMGDLPYPRPTFLLERGDYRAPGDQVYPSTPEVIKAYSEELPQNRLGLSKWLFDPEHPLTARVMVNRAWQMHFGRGLVSTADDFGSQGDLPSHPELLDWLARYFIDSGWDLKALHKLIVSSATYQQSSAIDMEKRKADPDNTLLWRGPRFRLPAEMIRDNVLAMSGLLVNKVGGSSQYPYQPDGLWDEISNKHWRYPYLQSEGKGLYRRSLYTIWKRTAPPPSMLIFDIADRDVCTVKRRVTQTPLQALVLLNDVQYIEAARALAEKLLLEYNSKISVALGQGFLTVIGRKPTEKESSIIANQFEVEQDYYESEPEKARSYLSMGQHKPDERLDQVHLAAIAVVIHSMMNTDEAIIIK